MIYKRRNKQRKQKKKYFKKALQVVLLVVESAPVHGVGLVFCDVFLVGGACACVLVAGAGPRISEGQCSVQ